MQCGHSATSFSRCPHCLVDKNGEGGSARGLLSATAERLRQQRRLQQGRQQHAACHSSTSFDACAPGCLRRGFQYPHQIFQVDAGQRRKSLTSAPRVTDFSADSHRLQRRQSPTSEQTVTDFSAGSHRLLRRQSPTSAPSHRLQRRQSSTSAGSHRLQRRQSPTSAQSHRLQS